MVLLAQALQVALVIETALVQWRYVIPLGRWLHEPFTLAVHAQRPPIGQPGPACLRRPATKAGG